ncbi:MAG: amino acid ABC transporter permease [Actinomycetota bacterium]|nr:amino acid ABC transporter permease [Actinomycetota bacterium]
MRWAVYAATLGLLAWLAVLVDWGRLREAFFDTEIFSEQFPKIVTHAARNTLIFTFFGFVIGLSLALLLALMRLSSMRPYRWFAIGWIELFRGVPALTTLLAVGFAVPIALQWRVPFTYGPGSVGLGIVYSAYMAETIRAGIEAVPKGQIEAARSLGMTPTRAMSSIVLPQAFRIIIPPLTNEVVALVKDTSLLYILGTTASTVEITKFSRDAALKTFSVTPLLAGALVYLAITIPLTRGIALLERRNRRAR